MIVYIALVCRIREGPGKGLFLVPTFFGVDATRMYSALLDRVWTSISVGISQSYLKYIVARFLPDGAWALVESASLCVGFDVAAVDHPMLPFVSRFRRG